MESKLNPMWTFESAQDFLLITESLFKMIGISLNVIGSVVERGYSDKDLDLLATPICKQTPFELSDALALVFEHFLPAYTVDRPQSVEPLPTDVPYPQIFINLGLLDGRTIEIYFPESAFRIE